MNTEFLLTSLVVVATPGTGVLYTVAAGLSRGTRAAAVAAVGCTLGTLPHLAAALTGLAALLHTSALGFRILTYLGVAYLLSMAWSTLRDKDAFTVDDRDRAAAPPSAARVIASGVLVNLLNPKLTLFFFAFLPQFTTPGEPGALPRMVQLSAVFMALTFVVFLLYGRFAAAMRSRVLTRPRVLTWLRRVFAGAFAALGARLAFL
ncbi:LysE family translocator [Streptomyces sp. NPDC003036]|uniref:LysE family translocator n=1 Tax=Streptomyces sp. NPDC003036 TaxID=3154442 RepID=UPI0033A25913